MRVAGILLIVVSAVWGCLVYRRASGQALRLIRALADDLGVLRCLICVHRCSLPAILEKELCRGISGTYLWVPFMELLCRAEGTAADCWVQTVDRLPREIAVRLSPVGKFLSIGGEELARVINEAQEELFLLVRERSERQDADLRLSAAVCFSLAALFIFVFA